MTNQVLTPEQYTNLILKMSVADMDESQYAHYISSVEHITIKEVVEQCRKHDFFKTIVEDYEAGAYDGCDVDQLIDSINDEVTFTV